MQIEASNSGTTVTVCTVRLTAAQLSPYVQYVYQRHNCHRLCNMSISGTTVADALVADRDLGDGNQQLYKHQLAHTKMGYRDHVHDYITKEVSRRMTKHYIAHYIG